MMSIALWLVILAIHSIQARPNYSSKFGSLEALAQGQYTIPLFDPNPSERAQEIKRNRAGYLYGPPLIGKSSFSLTGTLGDKKVADDLALWKADAAPIGEAVAKEAPLAAAAVAASGGLRALSDYETLYKNQWKNSSLFGPLPGVFTNYTQDLFFSMERLSVNPFALRRLHPKKDALPFHIDASIAKKVSGVSLDKLHATGRLFVVDHSYQTKYPLENARFAAACTAFFYIHPVTQEFLPLAIKTNVGSDLIYTPLDEDKDWLLAKLLFNSNDFFFAQLFHLAATHDVSEIVHEAALRTLSAKHPIRAYLDHVMYQAYAIRPLASGVLSTPGGLFSGTVSYNTTAVIEFIDEFYPSVGGRFQENYLERFFANRGLIGCSYGPRLAHFPYLEDAGSIYNAIHRFAKTFVYAYYPSPNLISRDSELQSWIVEASGPAKVLDFPASPLLKRETLAGILAQVAYLNGVLHHTINGATPSAITAVLPFHPSAIFAPIPTAKGVTNLLPYLPDFNASITQASYWQNFNRPQLVNSNRDLEEVFSSPEFRTKGPGTITARAALLFRRELLRISDVIEARTFDKNGLAQGMPFIWRCLDPRKIPYFLSV